MRLEATISDPWAEALQKLANEMKISKSQIIEEALALFHKAILETRKGRRMAVIDPATQKPVCEVSSPSLTQIEWTSHWETITLTDEEASRVDELLANPPEPTEALRKIMAPHLKALKKTP